MKNERYFHFPNNQPETLFTNLQNKWNFVFSMHIAGYFSHKKLAKEQDRLIKEAVKQGVNPMLFISEGKKSIAIGV